MFKVRSKQTGTYSTPRKSIDQGGAEKDSLVRRLGPWEASPPPNSPTALGSYRRLGSRPSLLRWLQSIVSVDRNPLALSEYRTVRVDFFSKPFEQLPFRQLVMLIRYTESSSIEAIESPTRALEVSVAVVADQRQNKQ